MLFRSLFAHDEVGPSPDVRLRTIHFRTCAKRGDPPLEESQDLILDKRQPPPIQDDFSHQIFLDILT